MNSVAPGTISLDSAGVLAFPLQGLQLIEASAGTGKTYTIANLYLRHVLNGRKVSEILVVTFTEAATDELRGRIRARLYAAMRCLQSAGKHEDEFLATLANSLDESGETDTAIRQLALAVRSMDEAAIFTIHGFCNRALNEFPFSSSQPFGLEMLTNDEALKNEAVRDWWRRTLYPASDFEAGKLTGIYAGPDELMSDLRSLLGAQRKTLLPEADSLDGVLSRYGQSGTVLSRLAENWAEHSAELKTILLESRALARIAKGHFKQDHLEGNIFPALDCFFSDPDIFRIPDAFNALTPQQFEKESRKAVDDKLAHDFFIQCGRLRDGMESLDRDLKAAMLADAECFVRQHMKTAKSRLRQLSYDDLLTTLNDALNSASGAALGDALRQRFPVAMIDEFQDTDPVQYQIFSTLYRRQEDTSLVLIGDPKQAIYGFRGGDIFTYMRARSEVTDGTIYTLDTNWRSSPGVIGAVNALFGRRQENAFVYGDNIPFSAASAAQKEHATATLTRRGSEQTPLTLWTIPDDGKTLNKNQAGPHTHTAVADEIAHLINEGRAGTALLNGTPVLPRDIAVLVNNSYEAADLRRELNRRGVSSVSIQHDNVFETREAEELALLLEAIIEPRDRRLARRALSVSLLGHDYLAINAIQQDEHLWSQLVDDLIDLSNTWQSKGFMPMFLQMMRQLQLSASIASGPQPERRLSNLLHLGELLQQASLEHSGMEALLNWLRAQRDVPAGNEAELRLESDEELVQLVTIHSSKGLQYPIVFVPYGWDCKTRDPNKGLLEFHRGPQYEACVDAGSPDLSAHLLLAEQERLAEDVRKIYVAVTRAKSALYLVWGKAKDTAQTGLAWLLHPHQSVDDLEQTTPNAFAGLSSLQPDIEQLVQSADKHIRVSALAQDSPPVVLPPLPRGGVIAARQFDGSIGTDWRINSFSSMTRGRHAPSAAQRDVIEDDPAMQFPAGSSVGSYLHTLFEHIDFHGDILTEVLQVSERYAPRYDIDHARWGEIAARWIQRVIDTPLDSDGLKLGELTNAQRLNEMEFDFSTCRIDSGHLDQLLSDDAQRPPLQLETFQGLVTGIIDLVFEHRGRYYVADYKSNFLGGRFSDYNPVALHQAVHDRHYDLQYLLYSLALHRYLRLRMPDYTYDSHFGGVYYLFLRGMQPRTGPDCGVFFDLPGEDLIDALDRDVFGSMEDAA